MTPVVRAAWWAFCVAVAVALGWAIGTVALAAEVVPAIPIPEPDLGAVLAAAFHVARRWDTVGTLGGLAALSALLMFGLRAPWAAPVRAWLDGRGVLPVVAGVVGALAGGLGAAKTHGSVVTGAVEGYLAGMAAVGLHQTITQRRARSERP